MNRQFVVFCVVIACLVAGLSVAYALGHNGNTRVGPPTVSNQTLSGSGTRTTPQP